MSTHNIRFHGEMEKNIPNCHQILHNNYSEHLCEFMEKYENIFLDTPLIYIYEFLVHGQAN